MTSRSHVVQKLSEAGFIAEEAGELTDRILKWIPSSLLDDDAFFNFKKNIADLCRWNGNVPLADARRELNADPSPLFNIFNQATNKKEALKYASLRFGGIARAVKHKGEPLEKRLTNVKEPEAPEIRIGFAKTVEAMPAPGQKPVTVEEAQTDIQPVAPVTAEAEKPAAKPLRESFDSYLNRTPSFTSLVTADYSNSLFFNMAAPPRSETRPATLATGNRHARRAAQAKTRHNEP